MRLLAPQPHEHHRAYSATGLPPGLHIDPVTGEVTGTPAAAGRYSVTVQETIHLRWPWSWLQRLRLYRRGPV